MEKFFALILAVMMMAACAFAVAEEVDYEYEMDFYDIMSEDYEPILHLYKQAYAEKWDAEKLLENNLWPLLNTMDEVDAKEIMVDFFNLEDSLEASMVVYINSAEEGGFADVLAIYTLKEDGTFVNNAIGGERSWFCLAEKDNEMYVLNQGSNSAFQSCYFFLKMQDCELSVQGGLILNFEEDAENPTIFYTTDMDFDVTNDTPMSNEDAQAMIDSYTPVEMGDPMTLLEL